MKAQTQALETETIPGGWGEFKCINGNNSADANKAQEVFKKIPFGLGMQHLPFAYATQTVNGTNYRFLCNSKVVAPNTSNQLILVEVHVDLNGEISIMSIQKLID